jgi:uncharacterized protein (DUF2342 family)
MCVAANTDASGIPGAEGDGVVDVDGAASWAKSAIDEVGPSTNAYLY